MKLKKIVFTILILTAASLNPVLAIETQPLTIKNNKSGVTFESDIKLKGEEQAKSQELLSLPSSFDLRSVGDYSFVSPVKNQNPWNNCWAFASLGAAESNAMMKGNKNVDLSERALTWFTYQLQSNKEGTNTEGITLTDKKGNTKLPFLAGGDPGTTTTQLTSWNGASTSVEAPYQNDEGYLILQNGQMIYSPDGTWSLPYNDIYDNSYHVQNVSVLSSNQDYSNSNVQDYTSQIKDYLIENGAVDLTFAIAENTPYFNSKTNAQYIPEPTIPNHAVTIIGWDDNYPVANFSSEYQPPANGAWLCKNSWGTTWGNDGYFYLSYYDQSITDFMMIDAEVAQGGYSYDNNLQYDLLGNKMGLAKAAGLSLTLAYQNMGGDPENVSVANVYTVDSDQILRAFSASTYVNTPTKVMTKVYILNDNFTDPQDGNLVQIQVDETNQIGFHTFEFTKPIELQAGQTFSIVQSTVYENVVVDEEIIPEMASFPIEYGLATPVTLPVSDGINTYDITFDETISINPNESYLHGFNLEGEASDGWLDLSNQSVRQNMGIPVSEYFNQESQITALPGNAMVKVYSTNVDSSEIPPDSISINDGLTEVYLATNAAGAGATTSIELTATLDPVEANTPITWVSSSNTIASISNTIGNTITVSAVNEGRAIISAISGSATTNIIIIVTNNKTVCDSIEMESISPDYYTVTAHNVAVNPALNLANQSVQKVSIFCWSDPNQSDISAKVARQVAGSNDWQWQGFAVNNNDSFIQFADNIIINVYGSVDPNLNGNMMNIAYYSWVNTIDSGKLVTYTTYSENIGFNHPPVTDGFVSGITNRDQHLEGIRVSSNINGVSVNSQVHVQNLGWLDEAVDGAYNGTMHQNLGIEAVKLYLSGQNSGNFQITYRVLPENGDWSKWVASGMQAGTVGENKQLRAIEIRIVPLYVPLF